MKRYNYRTDNPWFGNGFVQHSEGEWVKHKDVYSMGIAFSDCIAENARLKAKVERLTQAGNAMAVAVKLNDDVFDNLDKDKTISNWNAAKEGKPDA